MYRKGVFPGKYVQGSDVIYELPAMVRSLGNRGLLLASPSVVSSCLSRSEQDLKASSIHVETFQRECCEEEITRILTIISKMGSDVMIGMGGGKTIDTAKIAADRADIPIIVVPTIASTDAPCSGCAVLYTKDGTFQSVCYQRKNPSIVLVDLAIIAKAPTRFLVAGMGDALSTWFEARSCALTGSQNECGGVGTLAGMAIAKLCYDTLMVDGRAAKSACEAHLINEPFEHIVETNILLSGIGFESAGLASAHSIHNGLTALEETHAFYHGEKVAFGALAGLHLTGASEEEKVTAYSFCEDVGLPTKLADIGLGRASLDRLAIAAKKTCEVGQPIHHEAGDITPDKVLDAMLAADAMGRMRRN